MRMLIKKIVYDFILFLSVLCYDLLFLKDLIQNSQRYRKTVISLFSVSAMALLALVYSIFGMFTVAVQNSFIVVLLYIAVLSFFLRTMWRSRISIAPPISKSVESSYLFFHPTSESPTHALFFMHNILETAQKARLRGNLEKTWKLLKYFQSIWNEVLIQKIQKAIHR